MSVVVLGEALIDFIAGDDGRYQPFPGGSPYNVAIGLARQGVDVSYVSPLSDDVFGDQLRRSLLAERVALPSVRRSTCPTSLAMVTVDDKGMPTYRLYRHGIADKDTTFDEVAAQIPDHVRVFHTGSLALTPSQLPLIRRLFALMRERGATISVDINIRLRASHDPDAYLQGVRSILPIADIVKASDEDLEALKLADSVDLSAELVTREMEDGMLVLTRGSAGVSLLAARCRIEREACPVANLVDTIGAGDTFHSAFLASLLRHDAIGRDVEDVSPDVLAHCLEFAGVAASINVSRAGCSPPTRGEVEAAMASCVTPSTG